jgi:cytidine deaminase
MDDLLKAALTARGHAHAPYSGYAVGAALRDGAGRIHAGANVENAAYPLGLCAETAAIAAMVTAGGTEIAELLIVAEGRSLVTPCGGCRQRIREFAAAATPIHLADPGGVRRTVTLADLLPMSFGPEHIR